jgi:cysteine synthase A
MRKKILKDITDCIGKTPLIYMDKLTSEIHCRIAAKLEFMNPAGSVKDRIVLNIIQDAEKRGLLKPGATIIESTSGNTGIALAAVCAMRGYKLVVTMPDTMSHERRKILRAYGAELIITPGESGMRGAIQKAEEMLEQLPGAFMPQQFNNLSNPEAHFKTTGVEIWEDTAGEVDYFIAGIGTGGTITGVGRYLKKKNPRVKIIGIEPAGSAVISGEKPGRHSIQGIGAGFLPAVFDRDIVDDMVTVEDDQATGYTKILARQAGILAGISSGAAMAGTMKYIENNKLKDKLVVTIFPDDGTKYLNMGLFE